MTFAGGVLFAIGLYKEDAMVVSTNNIKKMESIKFACNGGSVYANCWFKSYIQVIPSRKRHQIHFSKISNECSFYVQRYQAELLQYLLFETKLTHTSKDKTKSGHSCLQCIAMAIMH